MMKILLLWCWGFCSVVEFLAQWGKERCAKALKDPPPPPESSR